MPLREITLERKASIHGADGLAMIQSSSMSRLNSLVYIVYRIIRLLKNLANVQVKLH